MYAPKLQPLTKGERWQLGFEYRIDQRAAEIKEEIKAMADKARVELGLVEKVVADDIVISGDLMGLWLVPNYSLLVQQQAAQSAYPYPYGMQAGAAPAWGIGGALGNPFGL